MSVAMPLVVEITVVVRPGEIPNLEQWGCPIPWLVSVLRAGLLGMKVPLEVYDTFRHLAEKDDGYVVVIRLQRD